MKKMKILFIQTGGTIDKSYPKRKGYAFEIDEPAVKKILEKIVPRFEYEIVSLLKKDSTDIDARDREKIYQYCKNSLHDKIIITHGTDTIKNTAAKLSSITDKTIILTGAFQPHKFSESDAEFNLGTAIGAINVLKEGVYVALNGVIYGVVKKK